MAITKQDFRDFLKEIKFPSKEVNLAIVEILNKSPDIQDGILSIYTDTINKLLKDIDRKDLDRVALFYVMLVNGIIFGYSIAEWKRNKIN